MAARAGAGALVDKKGLDVVMLDVGDLLNITDYFLVATGTSKIHAKALADGAEEALVELDRRPLRREGKAEGEWILLDYGDFVIHIFQSESREFYGLERLWGDAPRTAFEGAAADS